MSEETIIHGIVHGRTIELDRESGLPDGQEVRVTVRPIDRQEKLPPGEGIRRSAGGWADGGPQLDAWLEEMQRSRQLERPESQ